MPPHPIYVLTGPTAVGKTGISLALARRLGAEIISADSRQVYRGLDVGTAKPSPAERAAVPHHFVDELDLGEPFSAGRFAEAATERIRQLHAAGKEALVVGGSTLYVEALAHGLADVPSVDPEVRASLTRRLHEEGPDVLFGELEAADPVSAARLDPTKTQRVVRALEVYVATGRPVSYYQQQAPRAPFPSVVVVLDRPRDELYERINRRVDVMLARGLVDENRGLLEAGISADLNPLRTIGYQEPLAYLRGEVDYDEMVRRLKQNTRRYAKRQLTWFRRRPEYERVDVRAFTSADDAADALARLYAVRAAEYRD